MKLVISCIFVVLLAGCAGPTYVKGVAACYSDGHQGLLTASGERYEQALFTAAHSSYPMGTYVRVTNVINGKSVVVRINDRIPSDGQRLIEVSHKAAEALGLSSSGHHEVEVKLIAQGI